jgi:acetyltransferase
VAAADLGDEEVPPPHVGGYKQAADAIIAAVRKAGRTLLTEYASKRILSAYGIPTVETHVAFTEADAVARARKLGYPVAVKLFSKTLTHKTDVGGVQLDLRNATAVRHAWRAIKRSVEEKMGSAAAPAAATGAPPVARSNAGAFGEGVERGTRGACAPKHFLGVTVQPMMRRDGYELILGSSVDPQFGPVLLFGAGGQLVEVFRDRALGLPPLNATLARRLMERTRIYTALKGVRGRQPVDLAALENLLVRFSQLVAEQRWIKEIDINPLLVSSERMVALDARIVLHDPTACEEQLPKPAIRPYPTHYVMRWKLKNGAAITLRPIRPEDEPLIVKFHQTLSERSVYYRYFTPLRVEQRVAHERLARLCFIDFDRDMALVAEHTATKTDERQIIGVGRLSKLHGANEAEFAIVVSDQWQNQGLGTQLLKMLVQAGRDEGLARITATILPDNREMQQVCRKVGFEVRYVSGEGECQAEIAL